MRTRLALPFLLFVAACAGEEEHVPDAENGALIYTGYCSSCHGADGDAQEESELANGTAAAKLSEEVPGKTDEELEDGVLNGQGDMPALLLDEEELADLIAYLRVTFP